MHRAFYFPFFVKLFIRCYRRFLEKKTFFVQQCLRQIKNDALKGNSYKTVLIGNKFLNMFLNKDRSG